MPFKRACNTALIAATPTTSRTIPSVSSQEITTIAARYSRASSPRWMNMRKNSMVDCVRIVSIENRLPNSPPLRSSKTWIEVCSSFWNTADRRLADTVRTSRAIRPWLRRITTFLPATRRKIVAQNTPT